MASLARNHSLGLGGSLVGKPLLANLALLGLGQLSRVLALDQLDRPAGILDRLARTFGHAGDLERQLGLELALAEQPNAVAPTARQARGLQRSMIERTLDIQLAGVDR